MSFLFLIRLAAVTALKDSVNRVLLAFAFFFEDDFDGVLESESSDDDSPCSAFLFLTGDGETTRTRLALSGDLHGEGALPSWLSAEFTNLASLFIVRTIALVEGKYPTLDGGKRQSYRNYLISCNN